jgi:hypothetical protein
VTDGQVVVFFVLFPSLLLTILFFYLWEKYRACRPHRAWIKAVLRRERAMDTLAHMQDGGYEEWLRTYGHPRPTPERTPEVTP